MTCNIFTSVLFATAVATIFLVLHQGVQVESVQFYLYPFQIPGTLRRAQNVQFQVGNTKDGTYHFGYDTAGSESHKSYREEKREASGRVVGSYGYISPEGIWNRIEYEADEKGYRTKTANHNVYYEPAEIQVIGPIPKPFSEFYKF